MAKLADLLGKYLVEWPDGAEYLWQCDDLCVYDQDYFEICHLKEEASDAEFAKVTKSQYLAVRDRIATNMQATKEALEIARGEALPKPDRKLWKRAALAAFAGYCARPGMDAECAAEEAMFAADAFMNAMEKHLSSN